MGEVILSKSEFKLFNRDDQFGFFYDDFGFPKEDSLLNFDKEVDALYMDHDCIIVTSNDSVYGEKSGIRELILEDVYDAYDFAKEVKAF